MSEALQNECTLDPFVRRTIYLNELQLKEWKRKPMFPHCAKCDCFTDCYRDGEGPNFMDPSCGSGPIPIKPNAGGETNKVI